MSVDHQAALSLAVRQFNGWRFWDCHETLEDVWREGPTSSEGVSLADFYQGIIKVAAGFHHLIRRNHKGAVNLLDGGLCLLQPFRPRCLGVDVDRFLADTRACYDLIVELGPAHLDQFDRSLIPSIAFDPKELPARAESSGAT